MITSLPAAVRRGAVAVTATCAAALGLLAPAVIGGSAPAALAAPSPTGEFNYAEALQDSMLFYESQRSGKLPADNRVKWRGDSDLTDGADHNIDLTGGYHDAGDEVKFNFPQAYSMTALAWGGIANQAGYTKSGQLTYLLRNLRWGDDYLIKSHPSPHVFYGQVGDAGSDHSFWGPPEVNPSPRPSAAVTESCPGSDLTGEASAALASSSILFQSSDPTYAATLLGHARSLYEFAEDFKGKYDACVTGASGFYNSWSGYWDELTWGAIWLYKATGDATYLTKARTYYAQMPKMQQSTTPEYKWTVNWDDKSYGCYLLMYELTGEQQYLDDAERNLNWFTTGGPDGSHVNMSPGGEAQVDVWGTSRYAANAAFLALQLSKDLTAQGRDTAAARTYHDFATQQINYILGDNPGHESYLIGFTNGGRNTAWPQNPHSRPAHGSWDQSMSDPPNTRHLDYGLLVGGPTSGDGFTDDRQQYQQTEGALDYNALFSGALASLTDQYGGTPRANFPPTETPDGPEEFLQAAVNASGANFTEIKTYVINKSGWPARALTNASFRYYFTLEPGVTAAMIHLTSAYNQCSAPSGPTQYSGSTYYITVSCDGVKIAPSGQPDFRKEIQFRIASDGAWDPTNDWSYTGVATTPGSTPVTVQDMELYAGGTKVWGNAPTGGDGGGGTGGGDTTAPTQPGKPAASNITTGGATLTWAASTDDTGVTGYDVYQVSSTAATRVATVTAPTVNLTGLAAGTVYTFNVVARDAAGNTSTASQAVSFSTAPVTSGGCQVTYTVANDWGSGFTATLTLTNLGAPVTSWTVGWSWAGNQQLTSGWSATWGQSGHAVTATAMSYNGSLATGASTSIGFQASYSGSNPAPTTFTFNGTACTTG
ncbi:MAG: glycoside hydrolase family 9 protein [Mycobacteriales bacterium]